MKHVLSRASLEPLGELSRGSVLLGFDYDGTLAPITANPERAPMRARTRELLSALCSRYPCAVISGRARDDVLHQLEGVEVQSVAGNHGAERPGVEVAPREDVSQWRAILDERLRAETGVRIEDKQQSLSVHYRAAPDKTAAEQVILEAVSALADVRVVGGKDVVNVLPRGAPHKGFALDELRRGADCESTLYIGDDETDEDVFRMRRAHPIFTIRVGARRGSAAEYYLRTQEEVDELLVVLLQLRGASAFSRVP